LQNIEIDVAHAPLFHVEPAGLVKVDRVGPNQRYPVIVDYVFFIRGGNSKASPKRIARPVRRGAHYMAPGKMSAERVVGSASLGMGIGSSPHVSHAMHGGGFRLHGTANDQASDNSRECKVKALRHLQYRALNSN